jgi:hypothetical protein
LGAIELSACAPEDIHIDVLKPARRRSGQASFEKSEFAPVENNQLRRFGRNGIL